MKFIPRRQIGRYQIVAHLDSGGMADIFLARTEAAFSLTVIKVLREDLLENKEVVSMMPQEARIMATLDHPCVVRILDSGEDKGCPYLVMEYLAGDNANVLLRSMRKNRFSIPEHLLSEIGLRAAEGLAYIHTARTQTGEALGLVHRDVSPHNIFLCYGGQVKILDFGVAKVANAQVGTKSGLLKGKIPYMSPEQIQGETLDGRSDLFSLGVVLWELATGRHLFRLDNEYLSMKKICEEDAPLVSSVRPGFSRALEEIIARCLVRNPKERLQHASELIHQLLHVRSMMTHEAETTSLSIFLARQLQKRREQKRQIVISLLKEDRFREYLFADVEDWTEEQPTPASSSAVPLSLPQAAEPCIVAPRIETLIPSFDQMALTSVAESIEPDRSTPVVPHAPNVRRRRWLWLFFALVLAGGVTWWIWQPQQEKPTPAPLAVQKPVIPSKAPDQAPPDPRLKGARKIPSPPQAVVQVTKELASLSDEIGYLSVECDPPILVFVESQFFGKTPFSELGLKVGTHTLQLFDAARGLIKDLPLEIKAGVLLEVQLAF